MSIRFFTARWVSPSHRGSPRRPRQGLWKSPVSETRRIESVALWGRWKIWRGVCAGSHGVRRCTYMYNIWYNIIYIYIYICMCPQEVPKVWYSDFNASEWRCWWCWTTGWAEKTVFPVVGCGSREIHGRWTSPAWSHCDQVVRFLRIHGNSFFSWKINIMYPWTWCCPWLMKDCRTFNIHWYPLSRVTVHGTAAGKMTGAEGIFAHCQDFSKSFLTLVEPLTFMCCVVLDWASIHPTWRAKQEISRHGMDTRKKPFPILEWFCRGWFFDRLEISWNIITKYVQECLLSWCFFPSGGMWQTLTLLGLVRGLVSQKRAQPWKGRSSKASRKIGERHLLYSPYLFCLYYFVHFLQKI